MSSVDRFYLEIKRNAKPALISQRKEFMTLLIRALGKNPEAEKELNLKFGCKIIAKTNNGNTTKMFVDGEEVYKV